MGRTATEVEQAAARASNARLERAKLQEEVDDLSFRCRIADAGAKEAEEAAVKLKVGLHPCAPLPLRPPLRPSALSPEPSAPLPLCPSAPSTLRPPLC